YAVRLLNQGIHVEPSRKRMPPRRYDEAVRLALITVWKAANRICSKRLMPFLPQFVAALERFGHLALPEEVRERLLTMSPATADLELHLMTKGGIQLWPDQVRCLSPLYVENHTIHAPLRVRVAADVLLRIGLPHLDRSRSRGAANHILDRLGRVQLFTIVVSHVNPPVVFKVSSEPALVG